MSNNPLVSVIIPCFNSEKWIIETLDSVRNQSYSNIEIIIVDDGSTDNTRYLVNEYGKDIIYLYQENKGPSAARNLGIKNAQGKYVAFLDSDDLWESHKLLEQISFLEKNSDVALVFSNVKVIDEGGNYLYTHYNQVPTEKRELITAFFMGKIGMNTPTIVVRKEAVDSVGGFDESLPMREDHFFLMSMADRYSIKHFKEPLVRRRINEGSMSDSVEMGKAFKLFEPFVNKSVKQFPYLGKYKRHAMAKINMAAGTGYWKHGDFNNSVKSMLKAIWLNPFKIRNYISIVFALVRVKYDCFLKVKMKLKTIIRK
ncbi:MAG: glycosyltransferase [Bacteroidales bacterium]|nr:glycosyltransferase [Bacteroidales bacterium]